MMKIKLSFFLLIFSISSIMSGQVNDDFAKRLKGINNNTIAFFNVDGAEFSSQTFNYEFNDKNLKKLYRKFSIKDNDIKSKDTVLAFNNFSVRRSERISDKITGINSYYFVENNNKTISVLIFNYFNKQDLEFERKYINRILNDEIPQTVYESMKIDSIDFAGRKIKLDNSCYWTNVNTVQCPYYGEMNWSVHKTYEGAKEAIDNQLELTRNQKGEKIISENDVSVIFEGNQTIAKKIIYDFTGVKSLLASVSGGKELIVYYVASKVRENYVSCCMSFWNNDTINENGLAPLLEKVMVLDK